MKVYKKIPFNEHDDSSAVHHTIKTKRIEGGVSNPIITTTSSYAKEIELPNEFFARVEDFVSNVQTSCCAGEEEKEMIMNICKQFNN